MKKILLAFVFLGFLALPAVGLAQLVPAPHVPFLVALDRIVDWLFTFALIFGVIFIILAGIMYVTAQGDPEKVTAAGRRLQWALLGILIAFLAKGLVYLMGQIIGQPIMPPV